MGEDCFCHLMDQPLQVINKLQNHYRCSSDADMTLDDEVECRKLSVRSNPMPPLFSLRSALQVMLLK